jgi:pimeloyl-ACP methyl ester carboxylesterase
MPQPIVVLVHGMGGSAAAWSRVIPILDRLGLPNVAVDLPSCGSDSGVDDAAWLRSVLDGCDDDIVLVAHSAGGMVVTEVGDHPSVRRLVYVDAAMPAVGESLFALQADRFSEGLVECFRQEGDVGVWDVEALTAYLERQGWSNDDAREFASGSRPQRFGTLVETATASAWRTVPSTFVSCTDSEMNGELRQFFGSRATNVIEFPGDHFPLWVRPEELTEIIVDVARGVFSA